MAKLIEYAFVLDADGNRLAPTNTNKAWILIRKGKATLVSKYPMVIQLRRVVADIDKSSFICGIDDGSKYVGIAVVQKCATRNKVVFKGTIELRQDVKHLMDVRRGYRRYRRGHKRYRQARFNNRASSSRKGRLAPSIKQKRQSTLRVINRLLKYVALTEYVVEDVAIDIRALSEGYKPYKWEYLKSNRLDENLRKAVILRDCCRCKECGSTGCKLEVHHIVPKRLKGSNTLSNLITLCSDCHTKTKGVEELYIAYYQAKIGGKSFRFDYAQHVMQGKFYLRNELSRLGKLRLTTGGDTANKRIDWGIEKSHSNDAVVIAGLYVSMCSIKDWVVRPMRKKSKATVGAVLGYKHRDLVSYTKKTGESYVGYITALYPEKKQCNITTVCGKELKRYGIKPLKLIWRFNRLYWL